MERSSLEMDLAGSGTDRSARNASVTLWVVAAMTLLRGVVVLLVPPGDLAGGIELTVIAGTLAFCAYWARRDSFHGGLAALVLFIGYKLLGAFLKPEAAGRGLLWEAFTLGFLILAVKNGHASLRRRGEAPHWGRPLAFGIGSMLLALTAGMFSGEKNRDLISDDDDDFHNEDTLNRPPPAETSLAAKPAPEKVPETLKATENEKAPVGVKASDQEEPPTKVKTPTKAKAKKKKKPSSKAKKKQKKIPTPK